MEGSWGGDLGCGGNYRYRISRRVRHEKRIYRYGIIARYRSVLNSATAQATVVCRRFDNLLQSVELTIFTMCTCLSYSPSKQDNIPALYPYRYSPPLCRAVS